jgi:hypothetical protein
MIRWRLPAMQCDSQEEDGIVARFQLHLFCIHYQVSNGTRTALICFCEIGP